MKNLIFIILTLSISFCNASVTIHGVTFYTVGSGWFCISNNNTDTAKVLEDVIMVAFDTCVTKSRIDSIMDSLNIEYYTEGHLSPFYFVFIPNDECACSPLTTPISAL